MTNEMKLLTALCDALGFDVERGCVNQDDVDKAKENAGRVIPCDTASFGTYGGLVGKYTPDPIYEYKLTKRAEV